MTGRAVDAVLFDFAGVLTTSPFDAIGSIGTHAGIDPAVVLELVLGPYHLDTDHPWHRLERGEIALTDYAVAVAASANEAGLDLDFASLRTLFGDLEINDVVVAKVAELRAAGYRTALITNNVREASGQWRRLLALDDLFDVVVDSSEVGMRKPDPRIFEHALAQLGGVEPARAVFLDDAPGNVDGARAAGLLAIRVKDPITALAELDALLAGT
ncbi:HAD-IA family hydrolase [soil metagenome]